MKPLFVLFIAFILIGIIGYHNGETHKPMIINSSRQQPARSVIENENYAFWDKSFDRYASHWLKWLSADLSEKAPEVNNLRIHQANAGAHPDQYLKCETVPDTLSINH